MSTKNKLSRLVQERKERIQYMRDLSEEHAKNWVSKKWFLAMYIINTGVRRRLAEEYYQILLDFGAIEEKKEGLGNGHNIMFRMFKEDREHEQNKGT